MGRTIEGMRISDLHDGSRLTTSFPLPADRPFTTSAAAAAGLSTRNLTWLVNHGYLRRPVRGVYVATEVGDSLELRCAALRLVVPPDAVVCDRHAGWLHGADMVLAPGEHLDLRPISVFRPAGRGRLRTGLADSGERTLLTRDVVELHGLRVTTPLRTALDLGRARWPEQSLASLDQMLRLKVFCRDELVAELPRFRGARWVTVLRAMAPLADGRAESPPESVLRLRWIQACIGEPTPQLEVWSATGRFIARLDLGDEDRRFAAEYDGREWHGSAEQQDHDRTRRARARDELDYRIEVFEQDDLWGPGRDAERRLRNAAEEHRRHRGGSMMLGRSLRAAW